MITKNENLAAAVLDLMVISEVMTTLGEAAGQDNVPTTWLHWFGRRVSRAAEQVELSCGEGA